MINELKASGAVEDIMRSFDINEVAFDENGVIDFYWPLDNKKSEDVMNTIECLRRLGVKVYLSKKICKIQGVGLNGFNFKKNCVLNAGNSGTLARLILGLLIHTKKKNKNYR